MGRSLPSVELDLGAMERNLRREGTPSRVFYFEHGVDEAVQRALDERFGLFDGLRGERETDPWQRAVTVHRFLGHEFFRVFPPGGRISPPRREAEWAEEGTGAVASWAALEFFDWPRARDADLSVLDYFEQALPEDMRVFHVLDVWEVVRDLMGFENLCFQLHDDPPLVEAVFERVGRFAVSIARALCDYACFGALYLSDDLGHKTGLMLAPATIRHLILPWHRRIADVVHQRGKFLFFHSCGQMYPMLDTYIDELGIHAKHSFEEAVMPVTEAKRRFGHRVALLGGMDVDFLVRADEAAIREKTRQILDVCIPGGGYCLGSGNWVTSYVPVDNYLAMLDEARRYPGGPTC